MPPLVESAGLRNKPLTIALEEIAEGKILRAPRGPADDQVAGSPASPVAEGRDEPSAGRSPAAGSCSASPGGIAAYKAVLLARLLMEAGADGPGRDDPTAARGSSARTRSPRSRADPRPHATSSRSPSTVLHVRLAHEADVAVVAPATANVIARLALGLADDLVTSTLLEARCPLVVAPGHAHGHVASTRPRRTNLAHARGRGAPVIVGPVDRARSRPATRASGRMSEPEEIAEAVAAALGAARERRPRRQRRILVTAGPTHEPIDPVRFIGNRSTGRMGYAVAARGRRRGAARDARRRARRDRTAPAASMSSRVTTAEEMRDAVLERLDDADAVVMAAAVADFRPADVAGEKLKKDAGAAAASSSCPTPDILAELGERKGDRVLVGFAAETEDLEAAGRAQARVEGPRPHRGQRGRPATGPGSAATPNDAAILSAAGDDEPLRDWTKPELAAAISTASPSCLAERVLRRGPASASGAAGILRRPWRTAICSPRNPSPRATPTSSPTRSPTRSSTRSSRRTPTAAWRARRSSRPGS